MNFNTSVRITPLLLQVINHHSIKMKKTQTIVRNSITCLNKIYVFFSSTDDTFINDIP